MQGDGSGADGFFDVVREWRRTSAAHQRGTSSCSGAGDTLDDACCSSMLQEFLGDILSHGQMYHMSMVALASRQYSPRLETFRQLSEGWFGPDKACCWVVVNGKTAITAVDELEKSIDLALEHGGETKEKVLDIDHVFSKKDGKATVTLYGPLDSACSHKMHDYIVDTILGKKRGNVSYLWRPIPYSGVACQEEFSCSQLGTDKNMSIPGYGVDLAIKNMEYNARDSSEEKDSSGALDSSQSTPGFDIQTLVERYPEHRMELESFASHLSKSSSQKESSGIKVWDLNDIGIQTVEKVFNAKDGLSVLRDVAQNFPSLVEMVSKVPVSKDTRKQMKSLSSYLAPDAEALFVNGLSISLGDLNWHAILDVLRSESEFLLKLHSLGIASGNIPDIFKLRNGHGGQEDEGRGESFRLDFQPENHVFWMSNVEEDESFEGLPSRLSNLLQPSFMGQAPAVRRNIFTAFFVVDVGSRGGAMSLLTAKGLLDQGLPVRIGIIPVGHKENVENKSRDLTNIFTALGLNMGDRQACSLFAASAAAMTQKGWDMEENYPEAMYNALLKQLKPKWKSMSDKFDGIAPKAFAGFLRESKNAVAESVASFLKEASAQVKGLGIQDFPEAGGILIFNGALHHVDSAPMWRPVLINAWQAEVASIQRLVYENRLSDSSTDLLGDILLIHGAIPRFNSRILSKPSLLGDGESDNSPQRAIDFANVSSTLDLIESMKLAYFSQMALVNDKIQNFPITHWVIVNPSSDAGRVLMSEALSHEFADSRIGIVVNLEDPSCSNDTVSELDAFLLGLSLGPPEKASEADYFDMVALISSASAANLANGRLPGIIPEGVFPTPESLNNFLKDVRRSKYLEKHCRFVRDHLGLPKGISGVLTNGRFLEQRFAGDIVAKDFRILDQVAETKFFATRKLLNLLKSTLPADGRLNTIAALSSSVIMAHTSGKVRLHVYQGLR
jgi:UDP-glucose:glycoprotein glucosyltransferase